MRKSEFFNSWYELGQRPLSDGKYARAYIIRCRRCRAEGIERAGPTDEQMRKSFIRAGWDVRRNPKSHLCPACCRARDTPHKEAPVTVQHSLPLVEAVHCCPVCGTPRASCGSLETATRIAGQWCPLLEKALDEAPPRHLSNGGAVLIEPPIPEVAQAESDIVVEDVEDVEDVADWWNELQRS